jgi:hypothetical protein
MNLLKRIKCLFGRHSWAVTRTERIDFAIIAFDMPRVRECECGVRQFNRAGPFEVIKWERGIS